MSFSIPCAAPALLLTLLAIPKGFPHHTSPTYIARNFKTLLNKETRNRLDFLGGSLLLLATLTLTAGFEEADSAFPWRSTYVITLLVASGFLWIALALWERHVTSADNLREPVLPWDFWTNRVILGLLL
jgi:Na+/melibiose symporter-like transporter